MGEITTLGELAWTTDGCPKCGGDDFAEGCAAVLPVALLIDDGSSVVLAYRCRHGHDWTSGYDRAFAIAHAEASRQQLEREGDPHWPSA